MAAALMLLITNYYGAGLLISFKQSDHEKARRRPFQETFPIKHHQK
jgi:hypothetical protein